MTGVLLYAVLCPAHFHWIVLPFSFDFPFYSDVLNRRWKSFRQKIYCFTSIHYWKWYQEKTEHQCTLLNNQKSIKINHLLLLSCFVSLFHVFLLISIGKLEWRTENKKNTVWVKINLRLNPKEKVYFRAPTILQRFFSFFQL